MPVGFGEVVEALGCAFGAGGSCAIGMQRREIVNGVRVFAVQKERGADAGLRLIAIAASQFGGERDKFLAGFQVLLCVEPGVGAVELLARRGIGVLGTERGTKLVEGGLRFIGEVRGGMRIVNALVIDDGLAGKTGDFKSLSQGVVAIGLREQGVVGFENLTGFSSCVDGCAMLTEQSLGVQ